MRPELSSDGVRDHKAVKVCKCPVNRTNYRTLDPCRRFSESVHNGTGFVRSCRDVIALSKSELSEGHFHSL